MFLIHETSRLEELNPQVIAYKTNALPIKLSRPLCLFSSGRGGGSDNSLRPGACQGAQWHEPPGPLGRGPLVQVATPRPLAPTLNNPMNSLLVASGATEAKDP